MKSIPSQDEGIIHLSQKRQTDEYNRKLSTNKKQHWLFNTSTGPYTVIKKLTDVNYRIRKQRKSLVVHHNRCNDWLPTESPTELTSTKLSTLPTLQGHMQINEDLSEDNTTSKVTRSTTSITYITRYL